MFSRINPCGAGYACIARVGLCIEQCQLTHSRRRESKLSSAAEHEWTVRVTEVEGKRGAYVDIHQRVVDRADEFIVDRLRATRTFQVAVKRIVGNKVTAP